MFGVQKYVIGFVILLIVIVLIYFAGRKSGKGKNPDSNLDIKDAKAEIEKLSKYYKKPSFSDAQYKGFAAKIYEAMKGAGTDFDQIKFVFKQLKSDTDIYKLIEAFGVRDGETLNKWLAGELNSNEFFEINQITSKYAAYRF